MRQPTRALLRRSRATIVTLKPGRRHRRAPGARTCHFRIVIEVRLVHGRLAGKCTNAKPSLRPQRANTCTAHQIGRSEKKKESSTSDVVSHALLHAACSLDLQLPRHLEPAVAYSPSREKTCPTLKPNLYRFLLGLLSHLKGRRLAIHTQKVVFAINTLFVVSLSSSEARRCPRQRRSSPSSSTTFFAVLVNDVLRRPRQRRSSPSSSTTFVAVLVNDARRRPCPHPHDPLLKFCSSTCFLTAFVRFSVSNPHCHRCRRSELVLQKALADLQQMQTVHIIECRRVLKWTYTWVLLTRA
ncbi:uncharacterized protein LOC114170148 [Vigna unguiculata]|uniref:uncharacterized protein LOC114170148 n=1 Tax=Vigna unguiculata TaxID=3917 RepID=UPI001016D5D8|nr:uncharacterized protein LOC114170148 [Vigna unguiculata]